MKILLVVSDLTYLMTAQIQSLTKEIYGVLGMKGIVRVDYIVNDGFPFLIEINSVPGMSKESIVPQMMGIENLSLNKIFKN